MYTATKTNTAAEKGLTKKSGKLAKEPKPAKEPKATKPTKEPKQPTAGRPRPRPDADGLAAEEHTLITDKDYRNIIKGSILGSDHFPAGERFFHKRTVEIKCAKHGCANIRRIATSDLHQVSLCEECSAEAHREKRRAERAAATAERKLARAGK